MLQRDLSQGVQEVNNVLDCGNELIDGRMGSHGTDDLQNQVDYIAVKWKDISFTANERQAHIEETIAKAFHRDITSLQLWMENTEKNVDDVIRRRPSEREVEQYIKVW